MEEDCSGNAKGETKGGGDERRRDIRSKGETDGARIPSSPGPRDT